MNSLHTTPPPSPHNSTLPTPAAHLQWQRLPLSPLQTVQVLDFRVGEIALIDVEQGRVWVTCDGVLEDYFLDAGQRLSFTGPVQLRVSSEGHRPARLSWARQKAMDGATYPPSQSPVAGSQTLTAAPHCKTTVANTQGTLPCGSGLSAAA